ncbi:MAG: TolC family protein [Candidatus Eisenbacteria bacterium]
MNERRGRTGEVSTPAAGRAAPVLRTFLGILCLMMMGPPLLPAAETRSIAFHEAVAIALERNSALARAENAAALDRNAVSQARSRFLPDLGLGLSGTESRTRSFDESSGVTESGTSRSFHAGLSSSVVLFDGLANVSNVKATRLAERAGLLDIERTRQTVVFDVITGYLVMIEATEQARVQKENLAAQEKQEEFIRRLVDWGERPVSDLYQQQASVAAGRFSLVEAERALDLSRVDLVQTLRLDPAGEYSFEIPPLPPAGGGRPEPGLKELLERAFAERPDLKAQEARLEAAEQDARVAAAGRWPALSLSADYGTRSGTPSDVAFSDQLDRNRSGSVGLSLSLPLFDRFETRRAIERARINREDTDLALSDSRQEAALQVRRAILDRDAAVERLEAAEARALASEKALEFTEQRYAAGAATLYEVVLSRAEFVAASSAGVSARYTLLWQERLLDYYVGDLDPSGTLAP